MFFGIIFVYFCQINYSFDFLSPDIKSEFRQNKFGGFVGRSIYPTYFKPRMTVKNKIFDSLRKRLGWTSERMETWYIKPNPAFEMKTPKYLEDKRQEVKVLTWLMDIEKRN